MVFELLVRGIDLSQWADSKVAKDRFPELVRRLCFATANDPQRIEFAASEGTALHGYDGIVEASGSDVHVPFGRSVWELSAEQNHRTKAQEDFEKRTAKPQPFTPVDTTYVACTLRPWDKKEETIEAWSKRGWRDVKLWDCNSLEAWLHRAPAVHLWISRLLGKQPVEAWDIESFWENWSKFSNPTLTTAVVTAGYEDEATRLLSEIGKPGVIKIRAESPDLARAFAAAVLLSTEGSAIERLAARTVVVSSRAAWLEIISQHEGCILIPEFDAADLVGAALGKGHCIVQGLGQEHRADTNVILLRRRHPLTLKSAVEEFWPRHEEVHRTCERIANGFSAFRRTIAVASTIPAWANPDIAELILPAVLVGSWDESFEGDKLLIGTLAGCSYDDWARKIRPWLTVSDAPIRQVGSVFSLVDRRDSWTAVSQRLGDGLLNVFEEQVIRVLTEGDPRWDPDENKRKVARLMADKTGVSMTIKSGLADTLALLGSLGADINVEGARQGISVATHAVWKIFQATGSVQLLCSLSPFFGNLAEAAPDQFLDALEERVANSREQLEALFQDKDHDFFSSSSPHTTLLWALETVAWDRTYLTRVAILLARLTELDPGGTMANRPGSSLREIFLPWFPGTAASLDERLKAIDRLRQKAPGMAWQLMVAILPSDHDVSHPTSEGVYRQWGPLWMTPATNRDIATSCFEVSQRLIEDVGELPSRWHALINSFTGLHHEVHGDFFSALEKISTKLDEEGRELVWKTIRDVVVHHSPFPDADWSMSPELVGRFSSIGALFTPEAPSSRWAWLFEQWVELPDEARFDHEAREVKLTELRNEAIDSILADDELKSFIAFIDEVPEPGVWAAAVGANRELKLEKSFLQQHLAAGSDRMSWVARCYVLGRSRVIGHTYLDQLWDRYATDNSRIQAGLLRCMTLDKNLLERLAGCEVVTQMAFWNDLAESGGLFVDEDIVVPVTEALLAHGGAVAAIKTLSFARKEKAKAISPELIVRSIESAVKISEAGNIPWANLNYDLVELLNRLDDAPIELESRICSIEFLFARLLSRSRKPKVLHRVIAREPAEYMTLLSAVFKDEDGKSPDSDDSSIPAEFAYEILQSLRSIPGQVDDDVDLTILTNWVSKALELAKQSKRTKIFLSTFGQWLARCPNGRDDIWPHEAVREVIEDLEHEELEEGIHVGIMNLRGVYMKSQDEGGAQERALAERYRSWQVALSAGWPRTAKVLGGVATSYEHMALREDQNHI